MNDNFLKQYRRPPRPEFAAALYKRINQPMATKTAFSPLMRRAAVALALLLFLLTSALLVSPTARVFAQTILRQIGPIIFTTESPRAPEPDNGRAPLPNPTTTPIPPQPQYGSELEEVTARAGFQPALATYVPAGYHLTELIAMEYIGDQWEREGMGTAARYQTAGGAQTLEVQQSRFNTHQQFPVGDHVVMDVTVRGHEGIWLEQANLAPEEGAADAQPFNLLLWAEDEFVFALFSDSLPLAELMKVAESLSP